MINPRIEASIKAALHAFAEYNPVDAQLFSRFIHAFSLDEDFLTKVEKMDEVFNDNPGLEELREVFFDLLLVNFFSADVERLEEDYLESAEWEGIEEQTLDRGTELLNLLLYLNECRDENIDPTLEDYLKEFLLVDEDEFQDEYRIYEPVIANQILIESPVSEVKRVATQLPDSDIKELFYPMICFFQNSDASEGARNEIAENAVNKAFDMAVFSILETFI